MLHPIRHFPAVPALLALTLLRLAVAATLPLSPDEAYYWVWSRALAPGYLDHPPMVALWIRAGTLIAGQGALGVRLLAPFSVALGSWMLCRAGEDLAPGRRAGLIAAALLNASLLFGVGAVTMTPDTPLLLFWTATLAALARLVAGGRPAWWLAAGAAGGCAIASKYTGVLLAPAILLWLSAPGGRRWLLTVWPWLAALVAFVVFLPVLLWNAGHGWASFAKQGGRTLDFAAAAALRHLGELLGGQLGLATPLVFVLCVAGTILVTRHWREAGPGLLAAFTLVPLAVFVEHALGDRVQANWPAVIYPSAAIAAACLAPRWRRLAWPAVALGGAMTLAVYVQGVAAPFALPPKLDPTLRIAGWRGLTAAVARDAGGAAYVASDEYGEAALLARLLPPAMRVVGVAPRWRLFRLPDAAATIDGRAGLLLRSDRRAGRPDPAEWADAVPVAEVARSRDGVVAEHYTLYRVVGRPGAVAAVLPR